MHSTASTIIAGWDLYETVLNVEAWKKVVKLKWKLPKNKGSKIDKTNTLCWDPSEGNDKGWRGCAVMAAELTNYKEEMEERR